MKELQLSEEVKYVPALSNFVGACNKKGLLVESAHFKISINIKRKKIFETKVPLKCIYVIHNDILSSMQPID